jgi:hypothetical protein
MAVVHFYLYREQIILPAVVQTEDGFYMDARPVKILAIKDNDNIKRALARAFESQNHVVPTPAKSDDGGSVLLEALNLRKWSSFERFAVMYTIFPGGRYTTLYATGRGSDGMWSQDATRLRQFDPAVPVGILTETIVQELAKQPEARPERYGLAVIPKQQTDIKLDS